MGVTLNRSVDEAELTQALKMSVTCAILAEAGPQRSRALATLYKDERCSALPVFSILEKVGMGKLGVLWECSRVAPVSPD